MATPVWRSRPAFITSTFADMQAERDWLRDHVIPELQERLRQRRHHLEPIDLRWGVETVTVAEQHAKELLVLKVCLDEIKRSRPFLIALLGDRYGWVPPEERMQAAVDEQGFRTDVLGKSVTALEIEFGVLDSADQKRRSLFYLRDPLPYDQMKPETAALYSDAHNSAPGAKAAAARLRTLKERIERDPSLAGRVRHYQAQWDARSQRVTGLEQWGQQVLEDLWRDLDEETREFARQPLPSWQDLERWALEEFVENRGRGFIGRVEITQDLLALATGDTLGTALPTLGAGETALGAGLPTPRLWAVCVTGESGSGKSALFAHLYRQLDGQDDVLLLAHAAGISPRANQVDAMLRRWIGELARALRIDDPLPETATIQEVEEAFRELLVRAAQRRRVVVLIDALNQFEPTPRGQHLTWLPALWPDNVRLIATAIPGTQSQALARRQGVQPRALPLLNADEAEHIAVAVCQRYHRELNAEVRRVLLTKRLSEGRLSAGIPLWLELALEELNLLDADDFARAEKQYQGTGDERLRQMMVDVAVALPAGIEELYGYLLERAEQIAGWNWAMAFAGLVAVTRQGLRESDLRQLLPAMTGAAWDELRFATLRRAFRAHLVQRGLHAQWDFFHAQMRAAIDRQYFDGGLSPAGVHIAVADHLERLPAEDAIRQSELMFHQIGTQDRPRTARYYASLARGGDELSGATRIAAEHILAGLAEAGNPRLGWMLSLLDEPALAAEEQAALCHRYQFELWDALENDAPLGTRLVVVRRTNETLQKLCRQAPGNAGWQRDLSISHDRIGDVLSAQGDLTAALAAYRASLEIRARLAAADPGNAGWQRDLSVSHNKLGDVLRAQGDLTAALAAYRASLEISARLAAADPGNAGWQRDLAAAHCYVGMVLQEQGQLGPALEAYRKNRDAMARLAAADPGNALWQRDLSVSHDRIGDVLSAQGDLTAALAAYRASLEIRARLAAADPGNAGWQRDLWVSYWRMASMTEQTGSGDARQWWRKAYDVLSGMKQRGLFVSAQDEQFLSQLRAKIGE